MVTETWREKAEEKIKIEDESDEERLITESKDLMVSNELKDEGNCQGTHGQNRERRLAT